VVNNPEKLRELVGDSDIVISFVPVTFHSYVLRACLDIGKNFVNASYVNPEMRALDEEAKSKGIVLMAESGLDPGIDHILTTSLISKVKAAGGKILEYRSYCGCLPAP
jgi:saccharopine dehydrogenase (NADP+, L-glutamate forming)